jgi:phosphoglucosamine mutase
MSKERLFGTDGVRGVANEKLTAPLAMQLGMAAGQWIAAQRPKATGTDRPRVIIGRDTRLSGDMLEAALASGLAAMGVDACNVGVVPTPAVAQIVLVERADAGIVISASHNPFYDNGIKFFGANGKKLPDLVEDEIEAHLNEWETLMRPTHGGLGRITDAHDLAHDYVVKAKASLDSDEPRPLTGMKIVIDCANGAACVLAPRILRELGAELTVLNKTPDGVNINVDCGSTHPDHMAAVVREVGADAGAAFDGDADRVIMADASGNIVDGDRMMAILAMHLKIHGKLDANTVVATIMSNIGLELALEAAKIELLRTNVGDRYVAEGMDKYGAVVGGEQSGHILLPQVTPTGDGIITALQVLNVMRRTNTALETLAKPIVSYPQRLVNIKVASTATWKEDPDIQDAIVRAETIIERPIWLSVRASGTEPLIRVMAQGTRAEIVDEIIDTIVPVVIRKLDGKIK